MAQINTDCQDFKYKNIFFRHRRKSVANFIISYTSRKLTSKTLNEITDFYGKIGYTGISQIYRRVESKRAEDKSFDKLMSR